MSGHLLHDLLSLLTEQPRDEKEWYVRRYAVLFIHVDSLGLRDRFDEMLLTEYGVDSMTDLSAQDLMSVYRTVSKWFYETIREI